MLKQYQTLDALLEQVDSLPKPRQRQALQENRERALLARRLATVRRDVPIAWDLKDCRLPANLWNEQALVLMADLGFQSILKERGVTVPSPAPSGQLDLWGASEPAPEMTVHSEMAAHYEAVTEESVLEHWVDKAMHAPWLALDTETTSTDAMTCELVGISLSTQAGQAIYIPLGHRPQLAEPSPQISLSAARRILAPLLAGRGPRLAAHHAKFDWKVLRRAGFEPAPPAFDTMIASYLLDPDKATGHGLKVLGREICGVAMSPIGGPDRDR